MDGGVKTQPWRQDRGGVVCTRQEEARLTRERVHGVSSGRTRDLLTDNGKLVVFPFQSVQAAGGRRCW